MIKLNGITKVICLGIIAAASLTACEDDPPYTSYDPPPGFAFKYVLADSGLFTPSGGSTLYGTYVFDINDIGFFTLGSYDYFEAFVSFGSYYNATNRRWPARWNIESTSGCGSGTSWPVNVQTKLFTVACVPVKAPIQLANNYFSGRAPDPYMTFWFSSEATPPDSGANLWIYNEELGYVEFSNSFTLDSNSAIVIEGFQMYDQHHQVIVEFLDNPNGFNGTDDEFVTYDYCYDFCS